MDLTKVSGSFEPSEIILAMTGDWVSGNALSSANKAKSTFNFQEDRYLGTNTNNYSLMTILGVSRVSGIMPSDVSLDDYVNGASGSTGIVVFSDTTSAGTTANLYITGITNGTSGTEYGYTIGEMVTIGGAGGITASINTIDPPGLVPGTGTIVHSEYTEPITRHPEQTEMLRVIIDF